MIGISHFISVNSRDILIENLSFVNSMVSFKEPE